MSDKEEKANLASTPLQQDPSAYSPEQHKQATSSPRRFSLQTIALLITAGLVFTALLGGFITGIWEPFRLLCPFGLGVLAGQLPHVTPPPTQ